MKKLVRMILKVFFVLFVAAVLVMGVRGLPGNPTPQQLNTLSWKDNGPFELSPERGRFSILYSLVEDHSFQLQPALAKFTTPDVGYINGNYVSIFAPSVSMVAIPGYLIGKYFSVSQFGTFAWMALFALLNVMLIRAIAIKLGANSAAASIAGLAFLFGTPAFAYAVTLYEHHLSTFILLLSLYLLIRFNNLLSLFTIWVLYAFSFTVDYPNLFLLFPIAFTAFLRSGTIENIQRKFTLRISFPRLLMMIGVVIPLVYLLWVNQMSYNNPLQLSGTVNTVDGVKSNGSPIFSRDLIDSQTKKISQAVNSPPPAALTFFAPRNMLNGFYILLLSPDRGVIIYAPVVLFGIVGIYFAIKKKQKYVPLLVGIIGTNLVLYSMWGDPYGGWAFGARYLIPAYAILAIYTALFLTRLGKRRIVVFTFFIIFSYSVMVNTLGAVTSNSNPPKIQADALSNIIHKRVDYTFVRNMNELNINESKSFVFQSYASNYFSAWQYYSYLTVLILIVSGFLTVYFHIFMRKKHRKGATNALEQ